tara:strand:- start:386 stop:568 length:183 start_codon:yes stop_codon:yes gene_type:complete
LPIEVKYEVLPAEHGLPLQIDILSIKVEVMSNKKRKRKVELLHTLNESEIMQLEDEISEN